MTDRKPKPTDREANAAADRIKLRAIEERDKLRNKRKPGMPKMPWSEDDK